MITLKTLPQATEQEVFDQVVNHLLTQMKRSKAPRAGDKDGEASACVYRNQNGLKCAAGCLIADEEYTTEFDRQGGGFASDWLSLHRRDLVPEEHRDLIYELQQIHDNSDPEIWGGVLLDFAQKRGLKFNPPSTDSHEPK